MAIGKAVVTGASRGIGKASAIALAKIGFDVAITARTVSKEDQAPEPSGLSNTMLPGSLEETAEIIRSHNAQALPVYMDLMDKDQLVPTAEKIIDSLGRVDVLLSNAVYSGPGNYGRFLDNDLDDVADRIFGNVTAQMFFLKPILASMVERGSGILLFMTSAAAYECPFAMPGKGGWGSAYTVSKGGFHRLAIQLGYEYGIDGITALNLQPGLVATERVKIVRGPVENVASLGVDPEIIGEVIAHITSNISDYVSGETIQLQKVATELGIIPR
ncbi:MAG: SDR family oxidoreductase [Acidimicrobiales bacterium]|jgi:NAD(P)-dependent dehydrogenase (short-subunit alcohol dehydrogenase family)|nr:SDR family oxidoreductase [Acidimicrobiales bacterium]MDP6299486.1 SDR family oxidoreductase [Acidimicrobiales bacterium]HJM27496.1 SDR family oxidoreductase [Acidimicrobiales bacterium]HJM97600.1 SDR family oxidoreductase [Acidimicrobiales bacterium]